METKEVLFSNARGCGGGASIELKQIARVFPLVPCAWLAAKSPVTATLPGYEADFVSTNQKLKMTTVRRGGYACDFVYRKWKLRFVV